MDGCSLWACSNLGGVGKGTKRGQEDSRLELVGEQPFFHCFLAAVPESSFIIMLSLLLCMWSSKRLPC
jgi:hypothetical protein